MDYRERLKWPRRKILPMHPEGGRRREMGAEPSEEHTPSLEHAEATGPNPARAKQKKRTCLKCRSTFPSWGPQNRLCSQCRGKATDETCGRLDPMDALNFDI